MTYLALGAWVSGRGHAELAEIIANRPDARLPRPPRDVTELVARLSRRSGTLTALYAAHAPAAQVVEMIAAIGDGATAVPLADVARGLRVAPDDADLTAVLDWLAARALVWRNGDDLCVPQGLLDAYPYPHHLGPLVEDAYGQLNARELHGFADAWGVSAGRLKREVLDALIAAAQDGAPVRAVLDRAPEPIREMLTAVAWRGPTVTARAGTNPLGRPDITWAMRHGLLIAYGWEGAVMPAEIAIALRGPGWQPPFDPTPPAVRASLVATDALRRESAAAATTALERLTAVMTASAAAPIALLKSGGVGARELKRLAKASSCEVDDVRLWLEIGYESGLVAMEETEALATDAYDRWTRAEPADRLAALVQQWFDLPGAPTGPLLATATPALLRDPMATVLVVLRHGLLRAVGAQPVGTAITDPAELARLVRWQAPAIMDLLEDADAYVEACWREAAQVGVVALGALTPLGIALLGGDDAQLRAAALDLVGAPTTAATFQADLTVVVPGTPAGDLASLLDAAADRESRGGASVWRFSAASVRRALDGGLDGPALTAALTAASATGALPQPLTYLIADAGRQHGRIRVRAIGAVLHSDDTALIAELVKARPLAGLGLVQLAPTVLTSASSPAETVAALRAAGYAPALEDASGAVVVDRPSSRRAAPSAWTALATPPIQAAAPTAAPPTAAPTTVAPRTVTPTAVTPTAVAATTFAATTGPALVAGDATPADLAAAILAGPPLAPSHGQRGGRRATTDVRVPAQAGPAERLDLDALDDEDAHEALHDLIGTHATQLSHEDVCVLADALMAEEPVKITYRDAQGDVTQRVIEPLALDGHVLEAWCHLRDDERVFSLSRIRSVAPA